MSHNITKLKFSEKLAAMPEGAPVPILPSDRLKPYENLALEDSFTPAKIEAFLSRFIAICADPSIEAVSFDFFDTIVWRPFQRPTDLFWSLGKRLGDQGLLSPDFTPAKFAEARVIAESSARERKVTGGRYHEVTLYEIYQEFNALSPEARERAVEAEVEHEAEWTFVDPIIAEAIAIAENHGKRIFIVSNTYFSRAQIAKLIEGKLAIKIELEDIYVSSEYGLDKEGGLLSLVLAQRACRPESTLHVGDNRWGDVRVPQLSGITTLYYPKFVDIFPEIGAREAGARELDRFSDEPQVDLLPQLRRMILNISGHEELPTVSEIIGSYIVGPALCAYAHWLIREIKRKGEAPVLCLTREGLFLSEIIHKVAITLHERGILPLPFLSSRSIIFSASFFDFSEDELRTFLLSRRTPFTIRSFCSLVGFRKANADYFGISESLLDYPLIAGSPETGRLINAMLNDPPLKEAVLSYSFARRAEFKRYVDATFARYGIDADTEHLYVADVGWSGRSQRLLERVLRSIGYNVELHGLYMATDSVANLEHMLGLKAKGWLYDSGSPRRSARLGLQSKEIIEQVCSSHLGAVLAYDEWGEPIFGPDTKSLHQQVSLRRLRNAARNAVLNILRNYKLMEASGLMPHLTEPHSYRDAYLGMIAFPSEEEYSLFASWIHEENNLSDNTETLDSSYWQTFAKYATPQQFIEAPCYWKVPVFHRVRPSLSDSILLKSAGLPSFHQERPHAYTIITELSGSVSSEKRQAYFSGDGCGLLAAGIVCQDNTVVHFRNDGESSLQIDAVLIAFYNTDSRERTEKVLVPDFSSYPETASNQTTLPPGSSFMVKLTDLPLRLHVPVSVLLCARHL